jgi:hypothetical protein
MGTPARAEVHKGHDNRDTVCYVFPCIVLCMIMIMMMMIIIVVVVVVVVVAYREKIFFK